MGQLVGLVRLGPVRLGLQTLTSQGSGSIPGWGTKIPHKLHGTVKKKKKKNIYIYIYELEWSSFNKITSFPKEFIKIDCFLMGKEFILYG